MGCRAREGTVEGCYSDDGSSCISRCGIVCYRECANSVDEQAECRLQLVEFGG
jgi:hypothetical protein